MKKGNAQSITVHLGFHHMSKYSKLNLHELVSKNTNVTSKLTPSEPLNIADK